MREPPGLEVRPATFADRGAANRLLGAALVEEGRIVDADGVARAVELALAQGSSAWLVIAAPHGMPAGILLANPVVSPALGGAALRIEALYVAPQHRGKGIERALTDYVATEARNNGLRSIEAESPTDASEPAWEALGFTSIARRRFTRVL